MENEWGQKPFLNTMLQTFPFLQFCDVLKQKYEIRSNGFQFKRNDGNGVRLASSPRSAVYTSRKPQ